MGKERDTKSERATKQSSGRVASHIIVLNTSVCLFEGGVQRSQTRFQAKLYG